MKLLDCRYCYDFGHEWYLSLFCVKNWSALHVNLNADEFFKLDASLYIGINKGSPVQVGIAICGVSLYLKLFSECYY
jgi:hypothetical protein